MWMYFGCKELLLCGKYDDADIRSCGIICAVNKKMVR